MTRVSGVTKKEIIAVSKLGAPIKGLKFYPIYQLRPDGSTRKLVPFTTDEYNEFSRTFSGEYVLSNDFIR